MYSLDLMIFMSNLALGTLLYNNEQDGNILKN